LVLGALIVVAYHFPVHINTHQKVDMATVPVYMLAFLLPPAAAGITVGIAIFAAETLLRSRRGSYWSDIWTAASRWVVIMVLGSSLIGWLLLHGVPQPIVLLIGALLLFLGDVCTIPLVLVAINHRRMLPMIPEIAEQMWRIEAAQYLLAMIGVLLTQHAPWAFLLLILPVYLVYNSFRRAYELQDSNRELLQRMADMVDRRDPLTEQHSCRVAELAAAICAELQLGTLESELIVAAARVHDLGKIAISDAILNKPGPLTPDEWAVMTTHVETGATMLAKSLRAGQQGRRLARIIIDHHERWDGKGYPRAIAGANISLGGRIIAVADSFDVMTSDRPYRSHMSEKQALAILQQGRGTQWDPAVVAALIRTRSKSTRTEQEPVTATVAA
jgi:putative nucleotidyltransferase with HDIG domain